MEYDVIVIGGGPAGMMAAGRAAQCGARVLLLEKNSSLGQKLLITGGGRCNVTNAEFDIHLFLAKFKGSAKFLYSPFAQFGVEKTLDFFHSYDMPTKIEAEKRVFPVTDKSQSVFDVLTKYMTEGNVEMHLGVTVTGFAMGDGIIEGVLLGNGECLRAHAYILATGGKSHPETGSTGDGFTWLREIGHTIIESQAILVPVITKEKWVHDLSGVSLAEAKLSFFQNDASGKRKKILPQKIGKILFTHFGLSGPLVLNMSKSISEFLQYGPVTLALDLLPQMDYGMIDKKLQEIFEENKNKKIKNVLDEIIPTSFVPALLERAKIDGEKAVNALSREERFSLGRGAKEMSMTVTGLLGAEKAIVTSGGVALSEVDFRTMRSRLYPNLYCVGDILNIDRPSGGYSLQLCWTTGYVAGTSLKKHL
ncbi:MAG: aminoacetone oxidase family FAD-binding enzyme [Candidatus Moranbacteria bacterium]|nr:aminoacetone oxidase family FAD-binding enzyme [Candidatus Moranbacteria bacterium]MDD3964975.1 aminoacetone oxidase family FAD-binding enzyme [Candidatus Moranbacteria bacterium]